MRKPNNLKQKSIRKSNIIFILTCVLSRRMSITVGLRWLIGKFNAVLIDLVTWTDNRTSDALYIDRSMREFVWINVYSIFCVENWTW
jgi:hypothetical protein